jgi:predicted negative regulator of RcsB-dependent stress response
MESSKMKKILTAAAVLGMLSSPAFAAADCTKRLGRVDEALKTAKVSPEDMKKAEDIRAQGEALMKEGKHDECKKTLKEALVVLGVKKAE